MVAAVPYQPEGCGLLFCGFMAHDQPAAALPCVTTWALPSPMPTMQPAVVRAVAAPV